MNIIYIQIVLSSGLDFSAQERLTFSLQSLFASLLLSTMAPPAIIVGNALLKGNVAANDEWRKYGEARRQELLENDEDGRSFEINRRCSVLRYFDVGDRVSAFTCC